MNFPRYKSVHRPCLCLGLCCLLAAPASYAQESENESRTELDTITVQASAFERGADELAQPVDVLYGEDLNRKRAGSLGETLDGELGVSSADFGPGVGRPVIRGQGGPRVLMLENGINSMDASSVSADHAVSIDPAHAEQIEIIKGPATLLYGSGAAAGVINVVNGRLPREVIPGVHGSAALNYTDNADIRSGAFDLNIGHGDFVFRVDAAGRRAHDSEIPGHADADHEEEHADHETHEEEQAGLIENSSLVTESGSATAAWILPQRILSATVSRHRSNYGVPGHGHEEGEAEEEEEGGVRIALEQTRVDLNGEWFDLGPAFERLRTRIGINDYEHVELEGDEVGTVFDNRELELRTELTHAPWGSWRGVFGLQVNNRDFEAIGDEAFVPPVETRSAGLFWVEERPIGEHRVELGLRVEQLRHEGPSIAANDFTPVSLSAGYVHEINDAHHLRLTATRSQRAPVAEELYAFGPHLATSSFERGNAALGLETANNFEIGLDRHVGRWQWQLNLFVNQVDDYIYQDEVDLGLNADGSSSGAATGASDGAADFVDDEGGFEDEGELRLLDYRANDARFVGAEAETRWRFNDGPRPWELRLFADTVQGELAGGTKLPRITPTRVGAQIGGGLQRWYLGLRYAEIFEQDEVSPLETPTDGYGLLSFDLSYDLPGRGLATVFLRGRNLLDEEARRHTSFLKDVAPLPGASLSLGLRWEFDA